MLYSAQSFSRVVQFWCFGLVSLILIAGFSSAEVRRKGEAVSASEDDRIGGRYSSPQILNVSSYDPKRKGRLGHVYTVDNLAAFKSNGARALIARTSSGLKRDTKGARFLKAAKAQNLLLGAYHYVNSVQSVNRQAEFFVGRVRRVMAQPGMRNTRVLLVGDFSNKTTVARMVRFCVRVKELTGVYPLVYIEHGDVVKTSLRNADKKQKAILKKCPYWLSLYNHVDDGKSVYSSKKALTPARVLGIYQVWDTWALWQYGGVGWSRGKAKALHYQYSDFKSSEYFGNLAQPVERSVFRGSLADMKRFWLKHGWLVTLGKVKTEH